MSLALYRKYRPRTFAELIGQEHVTEPLSQALRSGRLNHAYLFSGPRGCGKTSSARILARSLNCERGPTPEPCGECESCRALSNDGPGSIDVIEIDAASHGGVDDARDLRERAFYTPVSGRYKIYVIDEAHMVSSAGFNALLKLVEEPPEFVKFVFATTEPEKVLPTIKSRTHHYPFRLIPPSVLRPYLEQLCAAEGVSVEPAVFPLVVRAGGGSVRDSLSVLDQLISGAGAEGVTYARAAALLGVTDAALIDEMCDALAAGDGAGMFATVDRVAEAGHDARRFAADLLERLRDLIILQQVPDAAAKGLLDVPTDQRERMEVHASQLGLAALSRCADIVHNGLVEMRGTASPRLLLELICARMLLPGADDSPGGLLHRLERMERRLGAAGDVPASAPPAATSPRPPAAASPPPPAAASSAAASPRPAAAVSTPAGATPPEAAAASPAAGTSTAAPAPTDISDRPVDAATGSASTDPSTGPGGVIDAAAIRRVWEEIIATVGRGSKRAAAVVREASVRDVVGNTIVLQFQHAVHATMLTNAPQPLLDAVREVLGGQWQVRCETRDSERGGPSASSAGVRPGGSGDAAVRAEAAPAPSPGAGTGRATDTGADPDWPEPARPGGMQPPASPHPEAHADPAGAARSDSGPGGGRPVASAPQRGASSPVAGSPAGGGSAAATGAALDSGSAPASPAAPAGGAASGPTMDQIPAARSGAAARPASAVATVDDEVDEVGDARADPLASGREALRLLQETLGAERIGETRP